MFPFSKPLSQTDSFFVHELSFLVLRFRSLYAWVSCSSLVSLIVVTVGVTDTVSNFVCVIGIEVCHDGCHSRCYSGLESGGIYSQD